MVNYDGCSRMSKESLNAMRFRNLTKKYLVDDDQIDAIKLKQLIHSASIVSERLAEVNTGSDNDIQLKSQLDELRSELSKKYDVLIEIGVAKARFENKNKSTTSSSQTVASKPVQIISQRGLQGDQAETDAASGERIHTLLQQQKVTQLSAESRLCFSYQTATSHNSLLSLFFHFPAYINARN